MTNASRGLLDRLSDDDRRALLAAAPRRRYAKGEVLFHEGDPGDTLHLVEKGHVAIRVTTALGDVATLTVLGPGVAFGEQALLTEPGRRTASAVALDAVETRAIHRDAFVELRHTRPQVDDFLVDVLAASVRRLTEHLLEALYVPVETRVVRRLLLLADAYGDGTAPITIPLTQDDLATMAGTTRPTANRVLKAAADDGLVGVGRGKIEVLDLDRLARRAR